MIVIGIEKLEDGTYDMVLRSVCDELTKLARYESALRTIRGAEDRGHWVDVYRDAGGGYEGLQKIAEEALR